VSEYILCAAIWYKELIGKVVLTHRQHLPINVEDGFVILGYRHHQCIATQYELTGLTNAQAGQHKSGFLTSKNRFVDREEALQIALNNNQVKDINNIRANMLFSEDLY
jgi:hypothetical protein